MSVSLMLENSSITATATPCAPVFSVQLAAKSEGDAKSVAESLDSVFATGNIRKMCEHKGIPPLTISNSSDRLIISWTPPTEIIPMFYEAGGDAVKIASCLVPAAIGSIVSLYTATDFNDILADPDTGIYSTFNGAKTEGILKCSAEGKAFAIDAVKYQLRDSAPEKLEEENDDFAWKSDFIVNYKRNRELSDRLFFVEVPAELAKAFQFLDVSISGGYHKDNMEKAAKYVEDMARLTAPANIREYFIEGFDFLCDTISKGFGVESDYSDSDDEIPKDPFGVLASGGGEDLRNALFDAIDKLDSISSASIDGIWLDCKPERLVTVTATFTNYRFFDLLKYMLRRD
jgi:hypothetical protein